MSLGALSDKTTYDRSYLSKLERGVRLGDFVTARRLDEVYGTKRCLQRLWTLAKDDAYLGQYQRFMQLESQATVMERYVPQIVPGLMQTEEYARELLWSSPHRPKEEDALEEQLGLRMSRQELVRNGDGQAHLRFILDESIFRRPLRDPLAWERQLERILGDARQPNITVQVLPFAGGLCDALVGSLTILWLPDGAVAAYQESAKTGVMIEEPSEVEPLKLSYDRLRDLALSPRDSEEFIRDLMKDGQRSCTSSDST